ncbi:hypothetical protein N8159_02630 [Planktomarina temperata]|nr:hypothetical protein [Planktomarina temperata]
MAWLKLIFFILVANFITGVINKVIGLLILKEVPVAWISFAVSTYLAYKILISLINKFPDNYNKHKGWLWIIYLLGPLGLFGYYVYLSDSEIAQTVYPSSAIFLDVLAGGILSFFVSEKITEKAKNDRLQKRRIAEAKAEAAAEAEAEAEARVEAKAQAKARDEANRQAAAEARAENTTQQSHSSKGSSLKNQAQNIDEKHYEAALLEYSDDQIVTSTYAKALVLNKGDEEAAKWTYVQLRAEKLQESEET